MVPIIEYTYESSPIPIIVVGVVAGILVIAGIAVYAIKGFLTRGLRKNGDNRAISNTISPILFIIAAFGGFMGMLITTSISQMETFDHNVAQTGEFLEDNYGITLDHEDLRTITGGRNSDNGEFVSAEYDGQIIPVRIERTPSADGDNTPRYTLAQQNTILVPAKEK